MQTEEEMLDRIMRNQIADKRQNKRQKTKADMRQKRVLYCTVHGIRGGILFIVDIIKFQDSISNNNNNNNNGHETKEGTAQYAEGDIHSWPRGWVREEEKASENKQSNKEAEETDKVEVTPGVTVGSLRSFRAALIGPTQGLPKRHRRRLRR